MHKLSIIIPAYNERATIEEVLEGVDNADLGVDQEATSVKAGNEEFIKVDIADISILDNSFLQFLFCV